MQDLKPPFPTAVIFDWDNTLIDNWDGITEALNKVRALNGLDTWTVAEARLKSSRALRVSFPEWFGDKWEEMRDIFYEHFYKVQIQTLRVLPGAEELLIWLREKKVPLFVVSTKRSDLLRAEAEYLGWTPYFVCMMGSLAAPKDKPDRMPVDIALRKAKLLADNPSVWFIGDTHVDVESALRSGCTPILVGNIQQGHKLALKYAFSDCVALKTALKEWNRGHTME
ncbi:MAG: HAD family hydrolase [Alphaproteobacteria bacterium]|nr:HAD family hydrolase [Alphaproteobacteria bacterium]